MEEKISNNRLYVNPNSMESIEFERRLAEESIEFYRHETGPSWGEPWSTAMPYVPQIVYTFFEKDLNRATAILDEIRKK